MKAKSKVLAGVALLAVGSTAAYAASVTVGGTTGFTASSTTTGAVSSGVVVTANVQPTLTMDLNSATIALGQLTSAGYSSGTINVEVGTNAANGVTVTADSANGGLTASGHTIQNGGIGLEDYRFSSAYNAAASLEESGTPNRSSAATPVNNPVTLQAGTFLVYSNNKPERVETTAADAVFKVEARADDITPANDNYSDTITFTVTGSY